METVRKVIFNPLATTKAQIRALLRTCPAGTAHPFSPEKILLCKTAEGTTESRMAEIDISGYPDDYFYNVVDLGEMGDILATRMAGFATHLSALAEYQIMQAPGSTFSVPVVPGEMAILAISERRPTYYDLCLADSAGKTSCYHGAAKRTFPGWTHSGDITQGNILLQHIKLDAAPAPASASASERDLAVFISGFQYTRITAFLGTHPALLVADHGARMLYLVPVPLDAATIGDATLCCPLVVRRRGDTLLCSILEKATTDTEKMCSGSTLQSPCFAEALQRATFEASPRAGPAGVDAAAAAVVGEADTTPVKADEEALAEVPGDANTEVKGLDRAVIATTATKIPAHILLSDSTRVIRFGTGLAFEPAEGDQCAPPSKSKVILPCIFGTQLEGPVLLATGTVPSSVPFADDAALREHYAKLEDVVVIVDERMTDNARTLAGPYRLNALFIVQAKSKEAPKNSDAVIEILNATNINAVTALAGPQSLVLVCLAGRYYFYRGLGRREHLNTSELAFGDDVTSIVEPLIGRESLVDARASRIVNMNDKLPILLPGTGQTVHHEDLEKLFAGASLDGIRELGDDIAAAVQQLQLLLSQKDLQQLGSSLVATLSTKIGDDLASLRAEYIKFVKDEYNRDDPASNQKKGAMLGRLKKENKDRQVVLAPVISSFAAMVSAQTTSKRTHDLKRLLRQSQIQGNVQATASMTFETLSEYLETHASDMGVMLVNIEPERYRQILGRLRETPCVDAHEACSLDPRVLHLDGFDAGILLEQSQLQHSGPLQRVSAGVTSTRPTMALSNLNQEHTSEGSMLAWACWDEFVNLDSPYTTRWLDKCNEAHIAAVRILTRETLGEAMISRDYNFGSASPEISTLMSALLMASMAKLAAMRTTTPSTVDKAEDTVTRLMRGLFGNLLTIAGSGLKPMSMVWQLFGLHPQFDLPSTDPEWVWYETVTVLYPYTGWPLAQFHENLEKLLDKAVVRVVHKNEDVSALKQGRMEELAERCRLRNIQLDHSRTILTVLMRLLTAGDQAGNQDVAAVAGRLLAHVPLSVTLQSGSYGRMIEYLQQLADGKPRRKNGDMVMAGVYTKRSAVFADLKARIAAACKARDWAAARHASRELLDKHAEVAAVWQLDVDEMPAQNMQAYRDLLGSGAAEAAEPGKDVYKRVVCDAEGKRVAWHVGKKGQFGDETAPPAEAFVFEMLTGKKAEAAAAGSSLSVNLGVGAEDGPSDGAGSSVVEKRAQTVEEEFAELESSMVPTFLAAMQKPLSAAQVCSMLAIPVSTMQVFAGSLNPGFAWEELPGNFKRVMLDLVRDRAGRAESRPTRKLLDL
ncbi:hypothetical protein Micbo1qcDRAFT_139118, partial [Microdochium bolleyi]